MSSTTLPSHLQGRLFATVPEVAGVLGCDPRTVRTSIQRGDIPATKTGVTYRVPVEWLRKQLAKASAA